MTGTALGTASTMLRPFPAYLLTAPQSQHISIFQTALEGLGVIRSDGEAAVRADRLYALLEQFLGHRQAQHTLESLANLPGCGLLMSETENEPAVDWLRLCQQVPIFDPRPDSVLALEAGVSYNMGSLIESVRSYFPSLETELIDPQLLPMVLNDAQDRSTGKDPLGRASWLIYRNLGWWGCLGLALLRVAARISSPPGWAAWPALVFLLTASFGGWTMTILGSAVLSSAP